MLCNPRTLAAAAIAAMAVGAGAYAGVETQQIEYSWDVHQGNERLRFDVAQFDTQGGTRILDSVHVDVQSDFYLGMIAENLESYAITDADWFVESAILMQFWIEDDFQSYFTGTNLGSYSADLAPADGAAQQGFDSVFWDYSGELDGTYDVLASQTSRFVGDGTIEAAVYPFLSLAISAPPPLFDLWIDTHTNTGMVTVQYNYSTVPEPAALALFVTGIFQRRRRRLH